MSSPQKITTYLWFNGNAEEAVGFYTSVFLIRGSRLISSSCGACTPRSTNAKEPHR